MDNVNQLGEKQWYIVTAYSMHERKVADNLLKRIKTANLEDKIFNVLVAETEEETVRMKKGVPEVVMKKKNLYPGYIFIEMIMTDDTWYVVRNTPGVTGIAGSAGGGQKPTPVAKEEIEPVLKRMGIVDSSMYARYQVGDNIKIIRGTLEGTEGRILSIDSETGNVKVEISFFGRSTEADVDFSEIEKI